MTLKRNPKLIEQIKKLSPVTKLVGFKLTATSDTKLIEEKIQQLFSYGHCDYIVQNDWSDIKKGKRIFHLYGADEKAPVKLQGLDVLSATLFHKILSGEKL